MRKVEYWVHTLVAAYVGLILVGECEPCDYCLVVPVYSVASQARERTAERDRADMTLALLCVLLALCISLVHRSLSTTTGLTSKANPFASRGAPDIIGAFGAMAVLLCESILVDPSPRSEISQLISPDLIPHLISPEYVFPFWLLFPLSVFFSGFFPRGL